MRYLHIALILSVLYTFQPVSATTIMPFSHLGECTVESGAVVLATALYQQEVTYNGMTYLNTRFEVRSAVKGPMEIGQEFFLRPYSKRTAEYSFDVSGDFLSEIGKTYLIWLKANPPAWSCQMLSYYIFEEVFYNQDYYMVPKSGISIEVMERPDGVIPEPLAVYPRDALMDMLRACDMGGMNEWDGQSIETPWPENQIVLEERAAPSYCDFMLGSSTTLARWKDPAVNVYYSSVNTPANFSSILSSMLSTMRANYPGIAPVNSGATPFTPTCAGGNAASPSGNFMSYLNSTLNGRNSMLLIFEDPCNEIANLTNCSGVLALGGSYSFSTTHVYKGETWQDAAFGYVVVNNGVFSCFSTTQIMQALTHELTHAYRMDHIPTTSPGAPGQNMNPTCCNAINTLDRNCMNYVYESAVLPVELTSFTAQRRGDRSVTLTWKTATENNAGYFSLERSADGRNFEMIAQINASNNTTGATYEWLDEAVLPGTNYYRLSQTDLDGQVNNLGVRSVKFDFLTSIHILPNPIARENAGAIEIGTAALLEGTLEIVGADGSVLHTENLSLESGLHRIDFPQSLAAGTYRAVLRNGQEAMSAGFCKL